MVGGPIHGENRPLLTNELVGFEKQTVHLDFRKYTDHFRGICGIYLKSIKEKPTDHNMKTIGLRNTRVLTNFAQNSPHTNVWGEPVFSAMAAGWFCEKSG
jgi:hypothetical protein